MWAAITWLSSRAHIHTLGADGVPPPRDFSEYDDMSKSKLVESDTVLTIGGHKIKDALEVPKHIHVPRWSRRG